jgi:pantoate--beta-alanine ligase
MTKIFRSVSQWRKFRGKKLFGKKSIGFVPTMGNLHQGHESLLTRSKKENDMTVVSIFVNPTQFDNQDDLKNYPRTLAQDLAMIKKLKIDYVLLPNYKALYPDLYRYKVVETQFSKILEGQHREGHFDGVLTVVLKLLLLVNATRAYFGEKDFQQLQLVTDMVKAFFLNTKIIPCRTIRDAKDLALSSRNGRLTADQYQKALDFPKLLKSKAQTSEIYQQLTHLGFVVDYVEEICGRRLAAVRIGNVRLIDNIKC